MLTEKWIREIPEEELASCTERYELAVERIREITRDEAQEVEMPYRQFFTEEAFFLITVAGLFEEIRTGEFRKRTEGELKEINEGLYRDLLSGSYETCYGNPVYAKAQCGETYGKAICFLYAELRAVIPAAFEQKLEELTILFELFIAVYNLFEDGLSKKALHSLIYWFESDYCEIIAGRRVLQNIDPSLSFAAGVIDMADGEDFSWLYAYGEYISDNEREIARFLAALPQEEINRIADTFTEGYRIGFEKAGKDLSKKQTADLRYPIGFERVMRRVIENLGRIGLRPVIYRSAYFSMNRRGALKIGFRASDVNPQYTYDHRMDQAFYLDKRFLNRKLEVMKSTYEHNRELARGYAGPAVLETFGEDPFSPMAKECCLQFSEKQQKLNVWFRQESSRLTNRFIIPEERSFSIIAFPLPSIGERFAEIFEEVIRINTLDAALYEKVQAKLIDALDLGTTVEIKGKGTNKTDLTVSLAELNDPSKETIFENCVADVNIPVGEVFTSPKLTGTTGVLEAAEVYLNGLMFKDLHVELTDGMVSGYSCGNFEDPEKGRHYFRENVLYHHETLPLGEFAIGTNTTAYRTAKRFGIADRFPILIAEKTGPHFALGDTCYSYEEDNKVFNPDGKEIIARDNEVSALRHTDLTKAYFGCHTDITIPWEELDTITVVTKAGERIPLIADGRFVLPGTEFLNEPLKNS